jgi:hypothetical protein
MANIPSNVSYGTVHGRFILAYGDTIDSGGEPDATPAAGSVFFTASPILLKNASASPDPVTILPATVEVALDEDGYLRAFAGTEGLGIRLVATDDPQNNPVNWTWRVDFRLTDQAGTPVTLPSFSFSLASNAEVDLTELSPVPSADGTFYLVGPTGATGATGPAGPANTLSVSGTTTGNAGTSASVTISGTSPTQSLAFTIPRGDKGDKGDKGDTGDTGPIGPTGATGIEWQGNWSNTVDYVNNDAVFHDGASWFASGNPPVGDEPSESSTYWFPLALQGATGATGATGPAPWTFIGAYDNGADYNLGDAVTYSGGFYYRTGNPLNPGYPPTPGSITASWTPVADRGEQGPAGSLDNLAVTAPITYNSGTSTVGFDWSGTTLDEIGNVSVASPNNGDLIKWNSTSSLWEKTNTIDGGTA